jgi:hypothetical protein
MGLRANPECGFSIRVDKGEVHLWEKDRAQALSTLPSVACNVMLWSLVVLLGAVAP